MKRLLLMIAFFLVSSFNLFGGWTLQESSVDGTLHDVHFVDSLHGWIAAGSEEYKGVILRTTNGGKNWEKVYTDTLQYVLHIGFFDSLEGWIGGSGSYYTYWWNSCPLLLRTTNGGITWERSKGSIINPHGATWGNSNDIDIVDSTHIVHTYHLNWFEGMYVLCDLGIDLIGGGSWYSFNNYTHSKVCFLDTLHGWAILDGRHIFYTDKGVESLSVICDSFPLGRYPRDMDFVDILHGWIIGDTGIVYHTVDGGTTWVEQESGVTSNLYTIDFLDSLNGWVAGNNGTIIRTRNGGENWEIEDSPVNVNLHKVCFVDTSYGWAIGDSGKILHYTSYGVEESEKLKVESVKLIIEPNPCRNYAIIKYELPVGSKVSLKIYDVMGRVVKVLVDGEVYSGYHKVEWNAEKFPSGIYFANLVAPNYKTSKKLILTK